MFYGIRVDLILAHIVLGVQDIHKTG